MSPLMKIFPVIAWASIFGLIAELIFLHGWAAAGAVVATVALPITVFWRG